MFEAMNKFNKYDWYSLFHNSKGEENKSFPHDEPLSHEPVEIKEPLRPVDPDDKKDPVKEVDLTGPRWLGWYHWPYWPDWTYWPADDTTPTGVVTSSLRSIWSRNADKEK